MCIIKIQKKYRQILAIEQTKIREFEVYKEKRLNELKNKQFARVIVNFLKESVVKINKERDAFRKTGDLKHRRKGIANLAKIRTITRKNTIMNMISDQQSALRLSDAPECIPSIYSIFRVTAKDKKRPLTPAERTQLQTEASSIRRKSIIVKRNYPNMCVTRSVKLSQDKQTEIFTKESKYKNRTKYHNLDSDFKQNTESSFNRINCDTHPPTPEFFESQQKTRKIS